MSEEKKPAIVQDGTPVLRMKAKAVPREDFGTKKLRDIIDAMSRALEAEEDGVAIAAPQIGIPLRIFVVSPRAFELIEETRRKDAGESVSPLPSYERLVAVNPEITKLSKKKVKVPEGCLSVRWKYGTMQRHDKATIAACDENGKRYSRGGSGLLAQIFQHETDHLDGKLFVDRATDIEIIPPEKVEELRRSARRKSGS